MAFGIIMQTESIKPASADCFRKYDRKRISDFKDREEKKNDNQWYQWSEYTNGEDGNEPGSGFLQPEHSEPDCKRTETDAGAFFQRRYDIGRKNEETSGNTEADQ